MRRAYVGSGAFGNLLIRRDCSDGLGRRRRSRLGLGPADLADFLRFRPAQPASTKIDPASRFISSSGAWRMTQKSLRHFETRMRHRLRHFRPLANRTRGLHLPLILWPDGRFMEVRFSSAAALAGRPGALGRVVLCLEARLAGADRIGPPAGVVVGQHGSRLIRMRPSVGWRRNRMTSRGFRWPRRAGNPPVSGGCRSGRGRWSPWPRGWRRGSWSG